MMEIFSKEHSFLIKEWALVFYTIKEQTKDFKGILEMEWKMEKEYTIMKVDNLNMLIIPWENIMEKLINLIKME